MKNINFLDYVPAVIWAVDRNLTYIDIQGGKLQDWGIAPDDVIGRTVMEFHHEDRSGLNTIHHQKAFKEGKVTYEARFDGGMYECKLRHHKGRDIIVGVATDITDRVKLEKTIERQSLDILEYSTPVVPVLADTVILPIVGRFNSDKAYFIQETVVPKVSQIQGLRNIIVDISGVSSFESETAALLVQIHSVLSLLGFTTYLTGVSPEVAQHIVQNSMTLPVTPVFASVKDAVSNLLQ